MSNCHGNKARVSARLIWTSIVFVGFYLYGRFLGKAELASSLESYMGMMWWPILLGLFLGGCIDYFVPDGFILKYLGSNRSRSLFHAVLAGFFLSACSHGILALAMQLYKKGASTASVVAFLLAAPWANLPITILLFGFFGWKAFLIILAAMFIALTTAHIYSAFESRGWVETPERKKEQSEYTWERVANFRAREAVSGVSRGALSLANMVVWWILIGLIAASVIDVFVPSHFITNYMGPDLRGLSLTLFFATIIEVCSEGSAPIAFELYEHTKALGIPFVFLMAGVATDYTEIGLIWTNIGKRAAIYLPIFTVPQILFVAWVFNHFL